MARKPKHTKRRLIDALRRGDPAEVQALLDAGQALPDNDEHGYSALLHAVHGRDVMRDERLQSLLRLLVERGAALNDISSYQESALRVLSRIGRFDAVRLLLEAGADESQLGWTPLIKAAALGTLADVQALVRDGAALEDRDRWSRTAWLVAIQTGDVDKARWLGEQGADMNARGRCGQPPLFYAVQCHRTMMLHWLLQGGQDAEQTDEFGATALIEAAEHGHSEGLALLLDVGAEVDRARNGGGTALSATLHAVDTLRLLKAGADPAHLSDESRRELLGLPREPDPDALDGVTQTHFERARLPRRGKRNPEQIDEPFWLAMIRAGVSGYEASQRFEPGRDLSRPPVWCARRFGQSITWLPDGRIVQIAGEHEDSYDPDFCIYNDVFVHHPDGHVDIYGYPEDVFAPTDFHTATLVGDTIILIGALGYQGRREFGSTPVYRLDLHDFRIERLPIDGPGPGWIYKHRAQLRPAQKIEVSGGIVATLTEGSESHVASDRRVVLDLEGRRWRES
ncbi:ankyrin repeat domain-containing protein [Aquincola sp. S2]|uniref:Ankyrin repeat domain-containing protein n=1 Tax=Pseudaquabacterium terrae TaxID=2732868 RepID=A0ABX2EP13_9BURK|nr:ankyrin repeat domain-containing protein [Aquabacterium terrae]NRF70285.1 ankyrin repeat domain-containing protein [Aquabacterium terrae]